MQDQLEVRILVHVLREDHAGEECGGFHRPAERPPHFVERLLLGDVVGVVGAARRMDPDRALEFVHPRPELLVLRAVDRT
ncbi:MAG: hypothetical protein NTZ72_04095, partial [Afipia sp.]|nr:hypothetical protein [Afipia sp.]